MEPARRLWQAAQQQREHWTEKHIRRFRVLAWLSLGLCVLSSMLATFAWYMDRPTTMAVNMLVFIANVWLVWFDLSRIQILEREP